MRQKIEITNASSSEMTAISNLLQLYLYEFSAALGTDVGADGRFEWDGLEEYWKDDTLHPFLVRVDGNLAGFALVQYFSVVSNAPTAWDMEDFFVLEKYRRNGIGTAVARHLFHMFAGAWEIRVLKANHRAMRFWSSTVSHALADPINPVSATIGDCEFDVFRFETK